MRPLAVVVLLAASCGGSMKSSLAERASFDLGCPVKESEITEIASGQYGVRACGCRATYVSYPGWTLNSVAGEACKIQEPTAPPAATDAAP
jgi:hypothetical protein